MINDNIYIYLSNVDQGTFPFKMDNILKYTKIEPFCVIYDEIVYNIKNILQKFIFEFNDTKTRKQIEQNIHSYLSTITTIFSFDVPVCESVTTDRQIDNNMLSGYVDIKFEEKSEPIRLWYIIKPQNITLDKLKEKTNE